MVLFIKIPTKLKIYETKSQKIKKIFFSAGSTTPWGYRLPYFSKNGVLPGTYTFFFIRTFKTQLGFMFFTFLCFKA